MPVSRQDQPLSPFGHDAQLIADFVAEWEDAWRAAESALIRLEATPDPAILNELFRILHSMKSNLSMVGLQACAALIHQMEEILGDLRAGNMPFEGVFGDLILALIDRLRDASLQLLNGDSGAWSELAAVPALLNRMHAEPARAGQHAAAALELLGPAFDAGSSEGVPDMQADLAFFRRMSHVAELRSHSSPGADARCERMALQMNELAGTPADPQQLSAAVAVHDLGMALLPLTLLTKNRAFDADEERIVHSHPRASADVLRHLPQWADAKRIVEQHHEHFNGQGYPAGARGESIHPGARLLAVVDTFEAMTQKRSYRDLKRPILRAVAEINAMSGAQFDPFWVAVFNRWVRQHVHSQRSLDPAPADD